MSYKCFPDFSKFSLSSFPFFVKLICFWIALFDLQRAVFIFFNWDVFEHGIEVFGVFFHSIALDIATAAFLSVLPLTFYFLYRTTRKKAFYFVAFCTIALEIAVSCIVHSAEIIAYQEWKHKLTSKVFLHLFNGNEVLRTAGDQSLIWGVFIFLIEGGIGALFLHSLFAKHKEYELPASIKSFLFFSIAWIVELGMCLLFARGGFQQIPINIDSAYFSKSFKINDISVNSSYFFANSYLLFLNSDLHKFVPKIDPDVARNHADSLYRKSFKGTDQFLSTEKPNIVLVILEGWSASALNDLEQFDGYQSQFKQLKKKGVYFDNIYATNTTSEIGHTSVLGGFPSLSEVSISNYPEKHRNITTINQVLSKLGYSANYIFGGDSKYGNIESFILDHEFNEIIDEDQFPKGLYHGKLSYHDEDLYTHFLSLHESKTSPFFSVIFTGSTHAPYDYPNNDYFKWYGKEKAYMNSLIYAENALNNFIEKAKKQVWYDNTLFVFISDHSHSSPSFEIPFESGFFKIPLLFYGNPVLNEKRGTSFHTLGSQADLPATLLSQLNLSSSQFPFSKDLADTLAFDFSMLATVRGYGYVDEKGSFMYHFDSKRFINNSYIEEDFIEAKVNSDALFRSFFDYYENLEIKKE